MSKTFDFVTNEGKIEVAIGADTYKKFKKIKEELRLNLSLSPFEQQCYDVNDILTKSMNVAINFGF